MSKIPKEIVDKIEQRKALNEEIAEWCRENLDIDGMNSDFADITDYHTGGEQGGDDCKEWCDQTCKGEDWYEGDYYWETECKGKYDIVNIGLHFFHKDVRLYAASCSEV